MQIVVTWWSRTRKWNTYSNCHLKNGCPINKQSNVPWKDDMSSTRTLSVIKICNCIDFKTAFNIVSGKCTLQSLFFLSSVYIADLTIILIMCAQKLYSTPAGFTISHTTLMSGVVPTLLPAISFVFSYFCAEWCITCRKEKCKKIWYYCSMGIKQI